MKYLFILANLLLASISFSQLEIYPSADYVCPGDKVTLIPSTQGKEYYIGEGYYKCSSVGALSEFSIGTYRDGTGCTGSPMTDVVTQILTSGGEVTLGFVTPSVLAVDYGVTVWIDYDHDGVFTEKEVLYTTEEVFNGKLNVSAVVPKEVLPGITRMRVISRVKETPSPEEAMKEKVGDSDLKDYWVNIDGENFLYDWNVQPLDINLFSQSITISPTSDASVVLKVTNDDNGESYEVRHVVHVNNGLLVTDAADFTGCGSFRNAIQTANILKGVDTITFLDELSLEQLEWDLGGEPITENVVIQGPDAMVSIESGGWHFFEVAADVDVVVSNVSFSNATTDYSDFAVEGSVFYFLGKSNSIFTNCSFLNNNTTYNGGAIGGLSDLTLTLEQCVFTNNYAYEGNGGAVYVNTGLDLNIADCQFTNNQASVDGGAVYYSGSGNVQLNEVKLTKNTALSGSGGALFLKGTGFLELDYVSIKEGTSGQNGGGVSVDGFAEINLSECDFNFCTSGEGSNGIGGDGAALFSGSYSNITIKKSSFNDNILYGDGVIHLNGGNTIIDSCFVEGNSAEIPDTYCAGILQWGNGSLKIMNTSIYNNNAAYEVGVSYFGDPMDSLFIYKSSIVGNSADRSVAGIWAGDAIVVIDRSNISENTGYSGGQGFTYGDYEEETDIIDLPINQAKPTLSSKDLSRLENKTQEARPAAVGDFGLFITNSTFVNNYSGGGGQQPGSSSKGIEIVGIDLSIKNTVIADSKDEYCYQCEYFDIRLGKGAGLISEGYNVISYFSSSNTQFQETDLVGTTENKFGVFYAPAVRGDNGLFVNYPSDCSPVVNRGDASILGTGDLTTLPYGGNDGLVDAGAVEAIRTDLQSPLSVTNTLDNVTTCGTLRNALSISNLYPGDDVIEIDLSGDDTYIYIDPYEYGPFSVQENVVIAAIGGDRVTVSGSYYGQIFILEDDLDVTFNGVGFQDGYTIDNGGAIISGANNDLTIKNCEFSNNSAYTLGGAIYLRSRSNLYIDSTTFENCQSNNGAAIFTEDSTTLELYRCHFLENTSSSGSGYGGAVHANSDVTISSSSFLGNGNMAGGALFLGGNNSVDTIINSTFIENSGSGESNYDGGAIYLDSSNTAVITNNTFYNNQAGFNRVGSAIYSSGNLTLGSNLIFNDQAAPSLVNYNGGSQNNLGYNLISPFDGSDVALLATDTVALVNDNMDINMIGVSSADGGFTYSLTFDCGSPAQNSGANPLNLIYSQTSTLRDVNGTDIGAYEHPATGKLYTVEVSYDGTGCGTLRSALENANENPGVDTIYFDLPLGDNELRFEYNLPSIYDSLVFVRDPKQRVALNGRGEVDLPYAILTAYDLRGYISVEGLDFYNFTSSAIQVTNANDVQVHDCTFGLKDARLGFEQGSAISLSDIYSGDISGNTFSGYYTGQIPGYSLSMNYVEGLTITDNFFGLDTNLSEAYPNDIDVFVQNSSDIVISNNRHSGSYTSAIDLLYSRDIHVLDNYLGTIPENNNAQKVNMGVSMYYVSALTISDNAIVANGNGISAYDLDSSLVSSNSFGINVFTDSVDFDSYGTISVQLSNWNTFKNNEIPFSLENQGISTSDCDSNEFVGNYIGLRSDLSYEGYGVQDGISLNGNSNKLTNNYFANTPVEAIALFIGSGIQNRISDNTFFCNDASIALGQGANNNISKPSILSPATTSSISGFGGNIGDTVEVYMADTICDSEGGFGYLGTAIVQDTYLWTLNGDFPEGKKVVATLTDGNGNTSEFSDSRQIVDCSEFTFDLGADTINHCGYDTTLVIDVLAAEYSWEEVDGQGEGIVYSEEQSYLFQYDSYLRVRATDSLGCVFTDTVFVDITEPIYASFDIYTNLDSVCEIDTIIGYFAGAEGGGNNPSVEWYVSDSLVGTSLNQIEITGFESGDSIYAVLTPEEECRLVDSVISESVIYLDVTEMPSTATIITNDTTICDSSLNIVASSPVVGSGSWVQNTDFTIDDLGATSNFVDQIDQSTQFVWMTENGICPMSYDTVTVQKVTTLVPGVAISMDKDTLCETDSLKVEILYLFDEGSFPVYTWYLNDQIISSSDSSVMLGELEFGDSVYVNLEPFEECKAVPSVSSNVLKPVLVAAPSIEDVVTDVTCLGSQDGLLNLTVEGGLSPFEVTWSDDSLETSLDRDSLGAGVYSYGLSDAAGCFVSDSITIGSPEGLVIALDTTSKDCYSEEKGSIAVYVEGGTPVYEYLIYSIDTLGDVMDTVSDLSTVDTLSIGQYRVEVIDANGCSSALDTKISGVNNGVATDITVDDVNGDIVIQEQGTSLWIEEEDFYAEDQDGNPVDIQFTNDVELNRITVNPSVTELNQIVYGVYNLKNYCGIDDPQTVVLVENVTVFEDEDFEASFNGFILPYDTIFNMIGIMPLSIILNDTVTDGGYKVVANDEDRAIYFFYPDPSTITDTLFDGLSIDVIDSTGKRTSTYLNIRVAPNSLLEVTVPFVVATNVAVSINQDGLNEFFSLENMNLYDETILYIYTKWGDEVIRWENRDYNDASNFWYGLDEDGNKVEPGTYYYVFEYSDADGVDQSATGYIEIRK